MNVDGFVGWNGRKAGLLTTSGSGTLATRPGHGVWGGKIRMVCGREGGRAGGRDRVTMPPIPYQFPRVARGPSVDFKPFFKY